MFHWTVGGVTLFAVPISVANLRTDKRGDDDVHGSPSVVSEPLHVPYQFRATELLVSANSESRGRLSPALYARQTVLLHAGSDGVQIFIGIPTMNEAEQAVARHNDTRSRIILVHGIRGDGSKTVDKVGGKLREMGWSVIDVPTKVRHTWHVRWTAKKDAALVAKFSRDGDILVAHSYGCLVAWRADRLHDYRAIFSIAPAMDKRKKYRHPTRVFCYFSKDDKVLKAGRLIPFGHPFGTAGLVGMNQDVFNIPNDGFDHNDYFSGNALTDLVAHIHQVAGTSNG